MNNLVVDVGNSKMKLAVFQNDQLIYSESRSSLGIRKVREFKWNFNLENVLVSSVRKLDDAWLDELADVLKLFILNAKLPLPINLQYNTPETLGSDRIAGAVAGYHRSKPHPVLVIDSGTCITYDVVDKNGNYQGGQISPGLNMRLKAMNQFTGQLPRATISGKVPEIGKSTNGSLQSGAFFGLVHEINGFIEFYKQRYSHLQVVITGGNSSLFVPKMKYEIFAVPNLIIMGLIQILRYNVEG